MDPGPAPHRPAAADAAAAACAQHGRPPPLPLPPNVSIAELPKQLRPTKLLKAAGVEKRPAAEGAVQDKQVEALEAPAGAAKLQDGQNGDWHRRDSSERSFPSLQSADHAWLSDRLQTDMLKDRPPAELVEVASEILSDVSTLGADCDRLFSQTCREVSGKSYIDVEKLHEITQLLLERFNVKSSCTMERVADVYSAVCGRGDTGLSRVEFRGYIAAVLTQVLQDLDARMEGRSPEDRPLTADAEKSDSGGIVESFQGSVILPLTSTDIR